MKRICDPSSGKLANTVYLVGRNGQIVRTRVIPANPNTSFQSGVRAIFAAQSARWDTITEAQRIAWRAAALDYQSKPRLGMKGPLTGNQFFVRVNCNLLQLGDDEVSDVPVAPVFGAIAPSNLVVTNTVGVIAVKLTCPGDPEENTVIRASRPVKSGVNRPPTMNYIGTCPAPAQGSAVITGLYTAKYGVPAVGKRIFVGASLTSNGIDGPETVWSALVPDQA